MTTTEPTANGVHLVGSVPLATNVEVFRTASEILGTRLRRIPDGETGERYYWIGWQVGVLQRQPELELIPPAPGEYAPLPHFRLKPGHDSVAFGPLGYAEAALGSYKEFKRLREEGVIPAGARFQVSLPTPLAVIASFIVPENQAALEGPYEERLLAELDEILGGILHADLAIQWDVAVEVALIEGAWLWPAHFQPVHEGVVERLTRLGDRVPEDVELGYHLCYGDAEHQHFKQPEDTSLLVRLANDLTHGVSRHINWIHLPVPWDRSDDAYFAPLKNLDLNGETELYLGLVHYSDGEEGTRRRLEAAQRTVTNFGVATECGMGRRPPETIPQLLEIHAAVAQPVAQTD